jgi:hypothetical protein
MGSGPGEVRSGPNETVEIRRRHQPLQFYFHEIELVDQEKFAFVTFLLADQKRIPGPRPFDSLGRSGRGREEASTFQCSRFVLFFAMGCCLPKNDSPSMLEVP